MLAVLVVSGSEKTLGTQVRGDRSNHDDRQPHECYERELVAPQAPPCVTPQSAPGRQVAVHVLHLLRDRRDGGKAHPAVTDAVLLDESGLVVGVVLVIRHGYSPPPP